MVLFIAIRFDGFADTISQQTFTKRREMDTAVRKLIHWDEIP